MYSPDGERLFTVGRDGRLRVHDVLQLYLPTKVLPLSSGPLQRACLALSRSGERLCTATKPAADGHAALLLFSGAPAMCRHARVRASAGVMYCGSPADALQYTALLDGAVKSTHWRHPVQNAGTLKQTFASACRRSVSCARAEN